MKQSKARLPFVLNVECQSRRSLVFCITSLIHLLQFVASHLLWGTCMRTHTCTNTQVHTDTTTCVNSLFFLEELFRFLLQQYHFPLSFLAQLTDILLAECVHFYPFICCFNAGKNKWSTYLSRRALVVFVTKSFLHLLGVFVFCLLFLWRVRHIVSLLE